MSLAEQMSEYAARPKPATYGTNDPRRIEGRAVNLPLPKVSLPPGFTNRRVSSPLDPHGERLAYGMAKTDQFARGAGADDAAALTAVHGFVRGFGSARCIGPDRVVPETEPVWRGVLETAIGAFHNSTTAARYERLGAAIAMAQPGGSSPRVDAVSGQLGAALALVEARPGPTAGTMGLRPIACDRDYTGERLLAGVAFARSQVTGVLREHEIDDVVEIVHRAADHYSAGFACFVRLERFGRNTVSGREISGDGIARAVRGCVDLVRNPGPGMAALDLAYAIGDLAGDCVAADAGSLASCAGQLFAAVATVQAIAAFDRERATNPRATAKGNSK